MDVCALCGKQSILQDSHLLPKWAYKRLQKTDKGRDDPIHVANGSAFYTSDQTKQHLLCEECEQRFSKREDYVSRLTTSGNSGLKILQYVTQLDTPKKVLVELSDEIDAAKLSYFAISIIWRSHVMHRGCHLGSYEPQFRRYLLEEAPFPSFAVLSMGIPEPSSRCENPQNWVTAPSSQRVDALWLHGFMLCGLVFRCFVGRAIKPEMKQICLAGTNPKKYAMIQPADQYGDYQSAFDMLATAKPCGKLAST